MEKAIIVFTRNAGGTTYVNPAWWAFDNNNYPIAGPSKTKREVQRHLAWVNKQVKCENYAHRPLYTGY